MCETVQNKKKSRKNWKHKKWWPIENDFISDTKKKNQKKKDNKSGKP